MASSLPGDSLLGSFDADLDGDGIAAAGRVGLGRSHMGTELERRIAAVVAASSHCAKPTPPRGLVAWIHDLFHVLCLPYP